MTCKKCGAETSVENAAYCNACGARLDGKTACPCCGGLNEPESAFCVHCGKRIDGKTVCPSCGTAHLGGFCPQCGASSQPVKAAKSKKEKKEKTEKKWWNKLFSWLTAGSLMFAAVLAFIFMFFIGTETEGLSSLSSITGAATSASSGTGIFDYLGPIYGDIQDAIPLMEEMQYGNEQIVLMYICAVLGTLVSIATLVCVTAFLIPAILKFIRFAIGKSEDSGAKFALKAVLSYLGGAAAICALSTVMADLSYSGYFSMEMGETLNGGTSAGIALCLVFALLSLASHLVSKGREWAKPAFIKKNAFIVGGLVLALVLFFLWKGIGVSMDIESEGIEAEIFASPIVSVSTFLGLIEGLGEELTLAVNCDVEVAIVYFTGIFAQLLTLGGILCVIGLIASRIRHARGEEGTGMGWIIPMLSISFVLLITLIVQKANMQTVFEAYNAALASEYGSGLEYYSSSMMAVEVGIGSAVSLFVVSLISLAAAIVQKILCKNKQETPTEEPVETPTAEIE